VHEQAVELAIYWGVDPAALSSNRHAARQYLWHCVSFLSHSESYFGTMDLLPKISSRYWQLKRVIADAALRLGIQRKAILVSSNKLILSMMYGVASYKGGILGMFTTGREALACLRENDVGVVISTIELEDGSGDAFITQARLLQPSLRCVLVADHHHYQPEEALYWQSPVIVAAHDIGHESVPWNQALLAAMANTTYRSPSIASHLVENGEASTIKLTPRERQMLECYALGLTNAQAAERLSLSPQSTKTYSRNLLSKLNVSNRQLALLKMMGRGFFPVKN
jgi:DNA-binding NarL/FixJ family response regulator